MPSVKWHPNALKDIERLHSFLKNKDARAAVNAVNIILKGTELLETVPHLGRPMDDETNRRELFIPFGSGAYIIRYIRANDEVLVIVRVLHSRETRI